MKRFISLLLVLVLLVGLFCGCGQDNSVLDTIKEQDKEALKSVEWTAGKIADGVYTNECINLTFQIPEGWIQASEEETRTILKADPNDSNTVFDVLVGSRDMNAMMALGYVDLQKQTFGTFMTEDASLEEIKSGMLDSPKLGDVNFSETESVSLCGREYRGTLCTASVLDVGVTANEWILLSRLGKDKMVMLLIRAFTEAQLAEYMAHFIDDPSTLPVAPVETTPELTPIFPTASFTRGELNGSSYTSQFLGLRFDAPDGCVFSTDRELVELMGLNPDDLGDAIFNDAEALTELFTEQKTVYDMVATINGTATDPDFFAMLYVGLENLSYFIGGTSLTEEEYAEILVEQLSPSSTYEFGDIEQQELAGRTFVVVPAKDEGLYHYCCVARVEGYMLVIFLSGTDSSVRDYADCFSKF